MDFNFFKDKISNLKNLDLPGMVSHEKMAPSVRKEFLETLDADTPTARHAAVMAVFFPDLENETHLLLILRKTYKGVHSNQVGFPGGKVEEEDEDLMQTALRETHEEVGIPPKEISVHKQLSKIYIPPSDFWVHPFIGTMDTTPLLIPQEEEVEEILEINLDDFLHEKTLIEKKITTSYAIDITAPAFLLKEKVVWGATAMILSEVKDLLREVL